MTNPKPTPLSRRVINVIGSRPFFWGVLTLFIFQAIWIALTARYPMAFDEDFHLGVIRIYSHQLSPFLASQPPGSEIFGALTRDPSYFYHYLMSFPYRWLTILTDSQTIQVLCLRILNVALFAAGLVLFRRLLLKSGASRSLVHVSLLVVVLFPIVPLVAGQINYDNLIMPMVALTLLLAIRVNNRLNNQKIDLTGLSWLAVICLLGTVVKYAFLPIVLAVALFLLVQAYRSFKHWTQLWSSLASSYKNSPLRMRWVMGILIVLSLTLFSQRYVVNMARYHSPVPDCARVLSVEQCSKYGPWGRDYRYKQNKLDVSLSPLTYAADWFYGMWLRTFFAVDGPGTSFQTRGPLLLPALVTMVLPVLAAVAAVFNLRKVFAVYHSAVLGLFMSVSLVYIAVLWIDGYHSFVVTTRPVAINGRYLLLIYPLIILIAGLCFAEWLKRWQTLRLGLAGIAVIGLLWGGGVLTYILRSNSAWYWPNHTVVSINKTVQQNVGRWVPGYNKPNLFMH